MMELPQPPQDTDLRNIIDKLAQFVARNGLEFEQMTKNKQKENPKFSFLFGGDHFNYYQYKVTTEQAILKQKSKQHHPVVSSLSDIGGHQLLNNSSGNSAPMDISAAVSAAQWLAAQQQQHSTVSSAPPTVSNVSSSTSASLESISQQKRVLQDQIQQSEQNLAAQHAVLMQQQQNQVEEALKKAQELRLEQLGVDAGVPFVEFDQILAPIIQSCTKDSISTGKGWILQKATSPAACGAMAQFLLAKVVNVGKESGGPQPTASPFSQRLHIIYLVNDVLHHCVRKNAEELRKALENVVVPMFCCSSVGLPEDQKAKLNKLLTLWESKSNYLDETTIEKLKNPSKSWTEYQANLIEQFSSIISAIATATKNTYENYQSQHQAFVSHALQQIQTLEQQQQALAAVAAAAVLPPGQPLTSQSDMHQQRDQQPPIIGALQTQPTATLSQPPPLMNNSEYSNPQAPLSLNQLPPSHPPPQGPPPSNFTQPPPGFFPGNFPPGVELPDFSRPPPGFPLPPPSIPQHQPPPEPVDDLVPSVPYFDLPAGLMVPLIKLDDFEYKPLDPDSIRLPPPAPPSERLLAAVEAFYAPPGHDRPRDSGLSVSRRIVDSDGWEKLGLYEYYRAKNQARKRKEEDIYSGIRERSRSPSPIVRPPSREKSPLPKKRYRSLSPEKDEGKENPKEKEGSRSPSKSPVRNSSNELSGGASNGQRSPSTLRRQARLPYRHTRSRSRSESRSRSRSGSRSPSGSRSRSSSRSRSRSPPKHSVERDRSPTPPSFLGSTYGKTAIERLDESNKGHQMLRKMGWGGAGLGAKEQGIEQPISGGEIRDRNDMYKGVGVNLNDPYENFRKNKGQAFISRMKARAEERI